MNKIPPMVAAGAATTLGAYVALSALKTTNAFEEDLKERVTTLAQQAGLPTQRCEEIAQLVRNSAVNPSNDISLRYPSYLRPLLDRAFQSIASAEQPPVPDAVLKEQASRRVCDRLEAILHDEHPNCVPISIRLRGELRHLVTEMMLDAHPNQINKEAYQVAVSEAFIMLSPLIDSIDSMADQQRLITEFGKGGHHVLKLPGLEKHSRLISRTGEEYTLLNRVSAAEVKKLNTELALDITPNRVSDKLILGTGMAGVVRLVKSSSGQLYAAKKVTDPEIAKAEFDGQRAVALALSENGNPRRSIALKEYATVNRLKRNNPSAASPKSYLIYELAPGGDGVKVRRQLATLKKYAPEVFEPLSTQIAQHVCAAVADLHANQLSHRDIKPANLLFKKTLEALIDDDFSEPVVALGDLSDVYGLQGSYLSSIFTGHYLPPEKFVAYKAEAHDNFALGLTLAEMFHRKGLGVPKGFFLTVTEGNGAQRRVEVAYDGVKEAFSGVADNSVLICARENPTRDNVVAALLVSNPKFRLCAQEAATLFARASEY